MKQNRHNRLLITVLVSIAALLLLGGCERGPVGIFASIEREVEIAEGNLLKKVPVNGMVESTGNYFAAVGGRIRWRPVTASESDWNTIDNPPGYDGHSRPTSIVMTTGGTIYVSFVEGERKKSGVFSLDPATLVYTAAGTEFGSDRQVQRLFALGNELFASVLIRNDDGDATYELRHLGTGAGAALDPPVAGDLAASVAPQTRPFISGATDGTNYWFITTNTVFHTVSPFTTGDPVPKPATVGTSLGGITVFTGRVYLSSRSGSGVTGGSTGYISSALAGGGAGLDWVGGDNVSVSDRAFTDFASGTVGVVPTLFVGSYRTLSGSRVVSPGGFWEIPDGTLTSGNVRRPAGNSYVTAQLSKGTVMGLFVPAAPDTVFALTGGYGLWRGDYEDGESTWVWE